MCRVLSERTGLTWIDVSKFAIENKCLEEYDDVYQCPILDEDKLLDHMEEFMCKGGKIVDYHGADFFPERWFDIVFVLRTDNTILYDRLKERGYTGKKLEDNIDCEIFQTILEEAKSAYREEIVHELISNNMYEVTSNVDRICQWLEQWRIDNEP
ncbi:adenylate kinase isoenzyme 6 isoform X2 [Augochlora pura]